MSKKQVLNIPLLEWALGKAREDLSRATQDIDRWKIKEAVLARMGGFDVAGGKQRREAHLRDLAIHEQYCTQIVGELAEALAMAREEKRKLEMKARQGWVDIQQGGN